MDSYPFLDYINEDKSRYIHAKDFKFDPTDKSKNDLTVRPEYWKTHEYSTYIDPDDLFLIGDSGGFLLNINPGYKFINTELFTEMADHFRTYKNYTSYKQDSILHRQLRRREERRRRDGYTAPCYQYPDGSIHDITITGAHYNFLNYTRMEKLDVNTIKTGGTKTAKKKFDFPDFIDAQFWTFKIMKFAEDNGFHLLIDKTRRGGFSYIMASDSANTVNAKSHKVVIHVAADKKYLTMTGGLTDFAVNTLKFYEENTPFVRGIFSTLKMILN